MKRLDDGKPSLVDFMRSIRYSHHDTSKHQDKLPEHFAGLDSPTRSSQTRTGKNQPQKKSL